MTDFDAAKDQECAVDVGASFIADTQAAVGVQPGVSSFHHPSRLAQPAAMTDPATRQHRADASFSQLHAMGLRIISAVALDLRGPLHGPARLSPNRADGVHQRQQLGHVMPVGRGDRRRKRDAIGVGRQVMLRPFFAAIGGIRPGVRPPKTARTEALSTTARDQSIWSASCSFSRSMAWIFFQTPAFCQSRNRRQQVIPDPQPISRGRYSQPMPVLSTNRMPHSAWRWPMGLRPGYRNRRHLAGGKMGSINFHRSSSNKGLAMIGPPCPTAKITLAGSFC